MKKAGVLEINQITKYLNGELYGTELSNFEAWLKDEANYELFKEYVVADHYVNLSKSDFNDKDAFLSFLNETQEKKKKAHVFREPVRSIFKYAAIFVGLVFSAIFFYEDKINSIEEKVVEVTLEMSDGSEKRVITNDQDIKILNKLGGTVAIQKNNELTYKSKGLVDLENKDLKEVYNILKIPYGKQFKLVLADGTEIQLNSGSTIKYPVSFAGKAIRRVELEGEAFFNIAKNKEKPFVVVTDKISTEVLGTQFNISHYKNDSFSEVVLVEGSVGVFKGKERFEIGKDILLKPNQKVRLNRSNDEMEVFDIDVYEYISWTRGSLVFYNKSFQDIMKKLERHYDIKVTTVYKEIQEQKFTGEFDVETVDQIMNTFQENTMFNYMFKNNQLIINK